MSVPNVKNKPYIIGLTGGIASGKSVAANYFKKSGIVVLDSDAIVQDLWQTNDEMVRKIEVLFDFEIKTKQDRKRISQIIFNDRKMRLKRNDIVHPIVFLELEKQLAMHQDQKLIVKQWLNKIMKNVVRVARLFGCAEFLLGLLKFSVK